MKSKIYSSILLFFFCLTSSGKADIPPEISYETTENFIEDTISTESSVVTKAVCEVCESCNVKLNFSNMNFINIPANFISSPDVKTLILQNNNLRKFQILFTGTFDSLPNLQYLDLSNNKLDLKTYFSFGSHFKLKTLLLNNNCGDEICITPRKRSAKMTTTTTSTTTTTTRYIYTYNNDYDDYDGLNYRSDYGTTTYTTTPATKREKQLKITDIIFIFPSLSTLSMRKININNILGSLNLHFPNLKYLDLSENDFGNNIDQVLKNIPDSVSILKVIRTGLISMKIESLQNVEDLSVDENNFSTLSSNSCDDNTFCLQGYHKLKKLTLSKCSIKKIETDAFKDVSELINLDISDNEILEIANETFDYIPSLQYLNLSRNYLKSMPDIGVLKNLAQLVMDEMKDASVFYSLKVLKSMKSLKNLSLKKNKIEYVPREFLNILPSLEELDLSDNKLTYLPAWQSQSYLQKLDLSKNAITDLQNLPMEHFESLKVLNLKNNSFSTIKMRYLKNLPDDVLLILD